MLQTRNNPKNHTKIITAHAKMIVKVFSMQAQLQQCCKMMQVQSLQQMRTGATPSLLQISHCIDLVLQARPTSAKGLVNHIIIQAMSHHTIQCGPILLQYLVALHHCLSSNKNLETVTENQNIFSATTRAVDTLHCLTQRDGALAVLALIITPPYKL